MSDQNGKRDSDAISNDGSSSSSPESNQAPSEVSVQCPDCRGTGTIMLLVSHSPCEKCYGTGKLPCPTGVEEALQAAGSKPEGESSRQMLIVITRTEFTEDEDGNIVDVKEISREEKLVPFSDAEVDWPPNSIMHESWPGGEIAYYEYDSTKEEGTSSEGS